MNIKKTIVASLLACMLPAVVMAKDVSIGVSMALFDDNFLTILRTSMQKEMKKDGVKSQIEDAKGDVSQQLQQVQNFIGQGVDAIIVNPVDTNAVKPIMDQATKAGLHRTSPPLRFLLLLLASLSLSHRAWGRGGRGRLHHPC